VTEGLYKRYRGNTRMGDYDHERPEEMFAVRMPMDAVAEHIVALNYGTHRLLSSLVYARRKLVHPEDELAQCIEDLLNAGYW